MVLDWLTMRDLDAGDLVLASDMDALRGNLLFVNGAVGIGGLVEGSNLSTSSSSYVAMDDALYAGTMLTTGRDLHCYFSGPLSISGGPANGAIDLYVDSAYWASTTKSSSGLLYWAAAQVSAVCSFILPHSDLVGGVGTHTFSWHWKENTANANDPVLYTTTWPAMWFIKELVEGGS